jgi:Ser-tRNA(Ala) deacylase AlaX
MNTNIDINQPNSKFSDMSIAPMHTAEHILNQTMVRMFGCERSRNAHIERKKSKCDYILEQDPSPEQVAAIEAKVNEVIALNLPVTIEFMSKQEAAQIVDLSKLPDDASQTLRIVRIGEYDACACIGAHVETTSEIGTFKIMDTILKRANSRCMIRLSFV